MAKYGYKRKKRLEWNREGYRGALLRMLPAVLTVGIVPLIVRQYSHENGLTQYAWFENEKISYEFFLGSKSFVLMLLAFWMGGCILVRLWKEKKKIPFVKLFLPLFGYGLLAFLSSLASVNRSFSFSGSYHQFETIWVILGYVLIAYYIFLYAESESELQVVTDAVCFGATVIGIIGTLQGINIDILGMKWFQKLITTEKFWNLIGGELLLRSVDNTASATLFNSNYLGVYSSMIVPFLTMLFLFEKNKWRKLWHGGNFILMMIALLSSRSRAGLIAAVAALCVAVIFAIRKLIKWWYLSIPALNFAVVLILLVNAYNDNALFDRLKNMFATDEITITEEVAEDGTIIRKTGLTSMYTTPEGVAFTYNEVSGVVSIYVQGESYGFYAFDDTGEQMELLPSEDGLLFTFTHPALEGFTIEPVYIEVLEQLGFSINAEGSWNFVYNDEKQKYQICTGYGKESDMIMADSIGFDNRMRSFSGRGFLWSRTLPLLKDYIFLGSGPDTFVLVYPQEDYLMMAKNGFKDMFVTKPHSLYLQVAVQTGVLSLLCMLVFYGWYAIQSIRLYAFRKLNTQAEAFGMAAFIASIGYMISGISNDSMVVTAPVFWGIIGLGIAANIMVTKKRKQVSES